jgi:hypothetical protein
MSKKAIVTLVIGCLGLAVTAWKGPSTWGAISSGVVAVALFFGTLGIVPKSVQDDLDAAVSALQAQEPSLTKQAVLAKARKRFMSVTGAVLMALGLLATACSATAQQVAQTFTDGWNLADCVLSKVLAGIVDAPSLLACAGATEQLVIDILNDFKGKAQAKLASASPTQIQYIDQAIANMSASLAKKAPGK